MRALQVSKNQQTGTREIAMQSMPDWVLSFPGAVTVTDRELNILYMNDKSAATYENSGGRKLIGTSIIGCHNERSRGILEQLIATGGQNVYTIDKAGQKKLIYQSGWKDETGRLMGLVEVSLVLPPDMPHYVRS